MNYQNRPISDLTLAELQSADWELATQEYKFNESLKHPKFEKLKPVPTISQSFSELRQEIKKAIEDKSNGN